MATDRPSIWRPLLPVFALVAICVVALFMLSDAAAGGGITAVPLAERMPVDGPRFVRHRGASTGLVFQHRLAKANTYQYLTNGSGLAAGDYDGDGLPDLYFVSSDGPNRLYRQVAPFRFEDVTEQAGGVDGGEAWGTGATFADIEGDGDLDLYVCCMEAPDKLYRNEGDGTFTEVGEELGLGHAGAGIMAAFCDYDRDGDLDLYLVTNRALHAGWSLTPEVLQELEPPAETRRRPEAMVPTLQDLAGEESEIPERLREHFRIDYGRRYMAGQADVLYRNEGGRFREVTAGAGIRDQGMGLSATWWDHDGDGWPDLYVSNDLESPDTLYRNDRDGTFTDITAQAVPHTAYYGMGSDAGDLDNDGRLDFIVADMSMTTHRMAKILMGDMSAQRHFLIHSRPPQYMRNALFRNTGTGRFQELAYMAGVASTDWTWSVRIGDLDNDGLQDVLFTNGIPRFDMHPDIEAQVKRLWAAGRQSEAIEIIRNYPKVEERNLALRNDGQLHFSRTGEVWGLDHLGISYGAALVDLDRDGDLDVVTNNLNAECSVFENRSGDRHAALVRLHGRASNAFGVGARIEAETSAGTFLRENWLSRGYMSGQEPLVHLGLGHARAIERLTVRWPSGAVQEFTDLPADHLYTVTEPAAGGERFTEEPPPPPTWFAEAEGAPRFTHNEREFDDYAVQFLLPHKLSRLGPGLAWGDADGDGDQDLFVGGAAGQSGALYVAGESGYRRVDDGPWSAHAESEDMGILWLDHDGDGDQDLFVVSGGVEHGPGDARLRDRLYRNDGVGSFTDATESALPDLAESGSCACAADFDRDGDLDLFVGGRTVPGQYPQAPPSRLLLNENGSFRDATEAVAPALARAGMVGGAVWSDVDGDGWLDLLVAAHWQPVRVLRNEQGRRLVDGTEAAGLAPHRGWWNSVTPIDVDNDGDMDYVAGNFGINHKYKATAEHPTSIYSADFDGDGQAEIVEAKYEGDTLLPVRGRSCSSQEMPFIAEKFSTYEEFANSTLREIYPPEQLQRAVRLDVTFLRSALLRNDGKGRFTVEPLPRMAQAAPTFGVVAADFDADGRQDLALAQNFFSPEPETGRMDGSVGAVLRGTGDGFAFVDPADSGVVVHGDAKALTLCDLDRDGLPDLLFSQNDGPTVPLTTGIEREGLLGVELQGRAGNIAAAGARVLVEMADGSRRTAEAAAGAGYLSQSPPILWFGLGGSVPERVHVRWPDGSGVTEEWPSGARRMKLRWRR